MVIVQPSFRDTIHTFFRRKFTFLLIFGGVCLAGAAFLFFTTPLYMSGASLVVRFDQHTVPDIDRSRSPTQPLGSNERREIIYSDADILRSPDLLRRAMAEVGSGAAVSADRRRWPWPGAPGRRSTEGSWQRPGG